MTFWDMGLEKVRSMLNNKFMAIQAEQPQVGSVQDIITKKGTPLRIYTPKTNKELPIILYIHGGAWVAGSLETHDNLGRYLCREVQALVVAVGYTIAPEGKFPLALEQCGDALHWIIEHAKEYQGNPARLAVVGDSAGGGMATALCLLERDRKGPKIDFQALINPVVNNTWGGTLQPQGDEFDDERWIAMQYVTDPEEASNPLVSPLYADDLSALPPALIILGEKDMFRQDAQKYADRLTASGIHTNVYIQWGAGHLGGDGGRASTLAQEALDVVAAALRGAFRSQ